MAGLLRQARGTGVLRDLVRGAASSSIQSASSSTGASSPGCSRTKAGPILTPERCRGMSSHVCWDYRGQRKILPLGSLVPDVAVDAWVAPNALLAGEVIVQDRASIWYGVVLRGDLNLIRIGPWSSVGDRSVLHAALSSSAGISAVTDIGKFVTVGAYSTLRSCTIENEVVIGQRCTIMEGSIVEKNAILASGSVIPPGRRIPAGEVWAGNPARFVREVTNDEIPLIPKLAEDILEVAQTHSEEFLPYSTAYLEVEKLFVSSKLAV